MTVPRLLVTFCNQLTSPRYAAAGIDVNGDGVDWLQLGALGLPDSLLGGVTGVCRAGTDLILTIQSTQPQILAYDVVGECIRHSRPISPCADPHSVVVIEETAYVVSTGTNEIYAVPYIGGVFGEPRLHWRYPGVEYDRDLVHLNGLTDSPDGLIASCFGRARPDGSWGSEGQVFRVQGFELIRGGLAQPHTPYFANGRLFFAESREQRVYWVCLPGVGRECQDGVIDVGGYARGLAVEDERLWVGISAPRLVSRSRGTRNPNVAAGVGAAALCFDLRAHTLVARLDLAELGEEVYDLLLLGDSDDARISPTKAVRERILNMHQVAALQRAEYGAELARLLEELKNLNADYERRGTEIRRLLPCVDERNSLREQLDGVYASTSWKITEPIRRFGRFMERIRSTRGRRAGDG